MARLTRVLLILLSVWSSAAIIAEESDSAPAEDASQLFHTLGCQLCHGVPAAGIEAKAKSERVRGADLGTAESRLDPEAMGRYLRQEIELDGKPHKREFKGSEEDMAALVAWLEHLSAAARQSQEESTATGGDDQENDDQGTDGPADDTGRRGEGELDQDGMGQGKEGARP